MAHRDKHGRLMVTVCDRCLCASCWMGIFMCQDSRGCGTVDLPVETVRELDRENEEFWEEGRED